MRVTRRNSFFLIAGASVLGIAFRVGWLGLRHHLAVSPIDDIGGFRSVLPGWPSGAEEVGLDTEYRDPLDEDTLVRVITRQRFNVSLRYLSLRGQRVTPRVAEALNHLDVEVIDFRGCEFEPGTINIFQGHTARRRFIVDPSNDHADALKAISHEPGQELKVTLDGRDY